MSARIPPGELAQRVRVVARRLWAARIEYACAADRNGYVGVERLGFRNGYLEGTIASAAIELTQAASGREGSGPARVLAIARVLQETSAACLAEAQRLLREDPAYPLELEAFRHGFMTTAMTYAADELWAALGDSPSRTAHLQRGEPS